MKEKPYSDPEARKFTAWLKDLGLMCEPVVNTEKVLTYEEFCFYPGVKFTKLKDTELYGFWKKYGDQWGEPRTVKEWLETGEWILPDPTEEDLQDYPLFLGYDEMWKWAAGKVEFR